MVRAPRRSVGHHDLQYAIEQLDTYLDISEDDLVSIYDLATPMPTAGMNGAPAPRR
jgi:hypothetical protein